MSSNEKIIKVISSTISNFSFRKYFDDKYPTLLLSNIKMILNNCSMFLNHLWLTIWNNDTQYNDISINDTISFTMRVKEYNKQQLSINNIFHIKVLNHNKDNRTFNNFIEKNNYQLYKYFVRSLNRKGVNRYGANINARGYHKIKWIRIDRDDQQS